MGKNTINLDPTISTGVKTVGNGCAFLFAIPFFGAGLLCLGLSLYMLNSIHTTRSWVEVPAEIISLPEKTGRDDLDNLLYRYQWQGRTHEGTRGTMGMKMKGEAGRLKRRVGEDMKAERQVYCHVNPKNPSESVLQRPGGELMPLFIGIFAVSHGGAGLALILAAGVKQRSIHSLARLQKSYPGEPWRWRPDWAEALVRPDTSIARWILAWLALVWNSIALWVAWLIFTGDNQSVTQKLIVLGVVAVGLIILRFAWKTWERHNLRRRLGLSIPEGGLQLGETVRASLFVPRDSLPELGKPPALGLRCLRKSTTRDSDGDRHTKESEVWAGKDAVSATHEDSRIGHMEEIALEFKLPPGMYLSGGPDSSESGIHWELNILPPDGKKGKPLASFALPVFHAEKNVDG